MRAGFCARLRRGDGTAKELAVCDTAEEAARQGKVVAGEDEGSVTVHRRGVRYEIIAAWTAPRFRGQQLAWRTYEAVFEHVRCSEVQLEMISGGYERVVGSSPMLQGLGTEGRRDGGTETLKGTMRCFH